MRKDLLKKRNNKVIERFNYWVSEQGKTFAETLEILSNEEFFITPQSILRIIKES